MRFLGKKDPTPTQYSGKNYENHAAEIRKHLEEEQFGFCAYSEMRFSPLNPPQLDHFDPRWKVKKKDDEATKTAKRQGDGYRNWYAINGRLNNLKREDVPHEQIQDPTHEQIHEYIRYDPDEGIFVATKKGDKHSENLIKFLGMNRPEVYKERMAHVDLVEEFANLCEDKKHALTLMKKCEKYLSFPTALKEELGIEISHIYEDRELPEAI